MDAVKEYLLSLKRVLYKHQKIALEDEEESDEITNELQLKHLQMFRTLPFSNKLRI